MKKWLFLFTLLLAIGTQSVSVFAHVLITDTSKTRGAILHIIPDDDPVAGKSATLYLDMQNVATESDETVIVAITDEVGDADTVALKVENSLAVGEYTFPWQGVYALSFSYVSGGQTTLYEYAQRVSRGTSDITGAQRTDNEWGQIVVVGSGIGLAILIIVRFNRRHQIADQSYHK